MEIKEYVALTQHYTDLVDHHQKIFNIYKEKLNSVGFNYKHIDCLFNLVDNRMHMWTGDTCKADNTIKLAKKHIEAEKHRHMYQDRCSDCAYLSTGECGEWFCENYEIECSCITDCYEFTDNEEYVPCATFGDYSPSCPWNAPGMSISDFI